MRLFRAQPQIIVKPIVKCIILRFSENSFSLVMFFSMFFRSGRPRKTDRSRPDRTGPDRTGFSSWADRTAMTDPRPIGHPGTIWSARPIYSIRPIHQKRSGSVPRPIRIRRPDRTGPPSDPDPTDRAKISRNSCFLVCSGKKLKGFY